ncbi:MAG: AAA family ATPase [Patescibacteria group bacterium]
MKLVLLYGPPAVGKLTIAKELQKLTGFKLLHNHQISDLVMSIHQRGTPEAADLNHQIRLAVYKSAVDTQGIISTVLYRYDIKDQIHAAIRDYATFMDVFAIRLSCSREVLEQRVASPDRMGTQKISSVEKLRTVLASEDLLRALPDDIIPSLHLDTTSMQPYEAANSIKDYIS